MCKFIPITQITSKSKTSGWDFVRLDFVRLDFVLAPVGETRVMFTRNRRTSESEGLIENLDVDILADTPFMEKNLTIPPATCQIILSSVYLFGSDSPVAALEIFLRYHRIATEIGRVKNKNTNPVAEKVIHELEDELLRKNPLGDECSNSQLRSVSKRATDFTEPVQ